MSEIIEGCIEIQIPIKWSIKVGSNPRICVTY